VTEINQAKSVGIDGFAVDIVEPTSQNATIVNLLNAAQSTGDFVCARRCPSWYNQCRCICQ
jgi:hypothetical protein